MNRGISAVLLVTFFAICADRSAGAITAELAKKCREMAFKAHPPTPTGAKAGTAKAQRDFYQNCIAKNGKI